MRLSIKYIAAAVNIREAGHSAITDQQTQHHYKPIEDGP